MQGTEKKVSDEQGGFRGEKSCAGQIFAVEMLVSRGTIYNAFLISSCVAGTPQLIYETRCLLGYGEYDM